MMTSTNDIFSEFEGIRRRMERTWLRAREEPSRLAVMGVASTGPKRASPKQR
ncbi:MAG: hypothetical protein MUP14_02975 [Dehalococcoidia bacterium]|nr:hypothetical protein [Dehalococcoidia bacterium]